VFLKLALIVERDSHGDIARHTLYDADDRDLKRAVLRFRELAVGFRAGECTIVLGRQRLTWGRTTFVNATDNLAPRDWTDPLDEVRLSPLSADLTWEHDRWHAEAARRTALRAVAAAPARLALVPDRSGDADLLGHRGLSGGQLEHAPGGGAWRVPRGMG
jgi:hypothetical protein